MGKKRILRLSIAVGLLACGFLAGGAHGRRAITSQVSDSDMRAIERAHKQDVEATLAHDPQALADLFTEDAVLLEPGTPAVVGRAAILANNKKDQLEHPNAKVVSYKPEIKDLQVVEGWAFEWDCLRAASKNPIKPR